jgi:hypothetical protein
MKAIAITWKERSVTKLRKNGTISFAGVLLSVLCIYSCATTDSQSPVSKTVEIDTDTVLVSEDGIGSEERQVTIVYYEKLARVAGKTVFLNYYDEAQSKGIVIEKNTDSNGMAVFKLPSRPDGASYIFRIALSKESLVNAWTVRIPPTEMIKQFDSSYYKNIIIKIDKTGFEMPSTANFNAPFQWIRFPQDGNKAPGGGDIFRGSLFRGK